MIARDHMPMRELGLRDQVTSIVIRRTLILSSFLLATMLVACHSRSNGTSIELNVSGLPVADASATFYLLDADPFALAMQVGGGTGADENVHRAHPQLRTLAGLMNARRREAYSLSRDVFLFLEQSKDLWGPHVIQSVNTDLQGRAAFRQLKPGAYWVMGYVRAPGGEAFWLQPVAVESGVNRLSFNRNNALYFQPQ